MTALIGLIPLVRGQIVVIRSRSVGNLGRGKRMTEQTHAAPVPRATFFNATLPILIVALGVLCSVIYRNPLLVTDPQMFSEDLFLYFNENRLFGASALIHPYMGYLQLCCRIIAYIVGFAPPHYAAALYAAFFIAAIFATAAVIYTSPIFEGWGKVLAALAPVCSPTNSEVFFGMCYTQWILAPVVGLALYESPTSRSRAAVLLGFFAMVGLSSPLVIIAWPFLLWKVFTERTRYTLALLAITALSAAVQLPGIVGRESGNPAVGSVFERAFMATSVLYSWATGPNYPGMWKAIAISVPTLALAIWYFWQNRRLAKRALIYFVAYGGLALIAGCLQVDAPLHANQFLFGARYFYPSVVLFVLSFIVVEQNSSRDVMTLPVIAVTLGSIYVAHVTNMNVHFTNRVWSETAACVEQRENCVSALNRGNTGSVRVPSDSELPTMSMAERQKFFDNERIP